MGDSRRLKKKYSRPFVMWENARIDEEKELLKHYGLKNKKEIWRLRSILDNFKSQAKKFPSLHTAQAKKEQELLINKLVSYGLMNPGDPLDKILGLSLKDLLEKRLETVVYRLGLASTVKQARQFIVHEHITINNKKLTSPSYLVLKKEEATIKFSPLSALSADDHPERAKQKEKLSAEEKIVLGMKSKKDGKKEEKKEGTEAKKDANAEKKDDHKESKKEVKKEDKKDDKKPKKEKKAEEVAK